jgi:hypothetical protein
LAERLRARREEIEQAIMTRASSIADPDEIAEPEYLYGLRAAVAAAVDYGLTAVEYGEKRSPPVPTALLAQVRLAARNGVGLDTVLRRYFSGYTLLGDFVLQEAEAEIPLRGTSLHRLLQAQTTQFDRVVTAVTEEYGRETRGRPASSEERRTERIERLLAGELVDTTELSYDFESWHVAAILTGDDRIDVLQGLAAALDRRLLLVRPRRGTIWTWLGGRHKLDSAEVVEHLRQAWAPGALIAIGEPARGLAGWRLSHNQAKTALPVAPEGSGPVVRYADVGLLASILKDEVLVNSLHQLYLDPLTEERDGGEALRATLRAYFSSGKNLTSAAAALKVSRQTVRTRLRTVEEKLGRSLDECTPEVEVALRIE